MAHAASSVLSGDETRQVQMICLDDLVPVDDDLRRIERLVDWDHVRRTAEPFYRLGGGRRPGMNLAVFVKLALVFSHTQTNVFDEQRLRLRVRRRSNAQERDRPEL